MQLSLMQVYELLANHELYVQTDRALGKHHFQFTLMVVPERRCVMFELQAMPVFADGIVARDDIDPIMGLHRYQLINAANELYLPQIYWHLFAALGLRLYAAFQASDALHMTLQASFDSADTSIIHYASVVVDERAAHRQLYLTPVTTGYQRQLVLQDGTIACISNGAGLMMAAVDAITHLWGRMAFPVCQLIELDDQALLSHLDEQVGDCAAGPDCAAVILVMYCVEVSCEDVARIIVRRAAEVTICQFFVMLEGKDQERVAELFSSTDIYYAESMSALAAGVRMAFVPIQG